MQGDRRRELGELGERIAREHLRRRGYSIVETNFRTRHGELDLVAVGDGCLVFCEVKTRLSGGSEGPFVPLASVGTAKRRQLRRMAREWFARRSPPGRGPPGLRFDAIGVAVNGRGELLDLEHVENAF